MRLEGPGNRALRACPRPRGFGLFGLYSSALMAINETSTTTAEPPVLEEGVWVEGPDGELVPDYESTFPTIEEGQVVHGTVVRVDKDEVLVDIGYKSEGVIPLAELSIRRSVNPADEVSLGDEIDALVLTKEDAEGRLILSKKRARFEMAWKKIEEAAESGQPVDRTGDRGRQGRPDPRPRRPRLPAGLARRHPPRAGSRRVHGAGAPLQGDRAQPLAEQRRPLAPRRPRGRAQGDAPGDPRPAQPGRRRRGPDLQHRRLRRVRRPRRDGRAHPHLRALVVAREPPERGARDRPDRRA